MHGEPVTHGPRNAHAKAPRQNPRLAQSAPTPLGPQKGVIYTEVAMSPPSEAPVGAKWSNIVSIFRRGEGFAGEPGRLI